MDSVIILLILLDILMLMATTALFMLCKERLRDLDIVVDANESAEILLRQNVEKLQSLHAKTMEHMAVMQDKVSAHDFAIKGVRK